jgi:GTP-binding protein
MKFVDEADIEVQAGDGGAGCVAFLREKYRPKGGPAGGNGGHGGDVVFAVDSGLSTLLDFKFQPLLRARHGEPGRGKEQHGKAGEDLLVRVPLGTIVRDRESGEIVADLDHPAARAVVARGGRGGRGNATYATATNQAPRYAQPGTPGEHRQLRLELRLMADVGLIGFPNVGKSTLISRVSAARPRVADYPFTTLVPHLGVVRLGDEESFVLADIPGLTEGAHEGHGLGDRFLRHVSRTGLLIHLIDASGIEGRDPLDDYDGINRELARFDPELARKPQIVAGNKIDLVAEPERLDELTKRFRRRGLELHLVSAATGAGVSDLMRAAGAGVRRARAAERDRAGASLGHG